LQSLARDLIESLVESRAVSLAHGGHDVQRELPRRSLPGLHSRGRITVGKGRSMPRIFTRDRALPFLDRGSWDRIADP